MDAQSLYYLATALRTAAGEGFMAREHAAKVWKQALKNSAFDVPKEAAVPATRLTVRQYYQDFAGGTNYPANVEKEEP